jgi:two-component system response regulator PilR (NtrC family)
VRIVAATNRNLESQVAEGAFREDLFYRLNVVPIHLPSLRERPDDIPLLVEHFYCKLTGSAKATNIITPEAMKFLWGYPFPGNVRELENIVERSLALGGREITMESLPPQLVRFQKSLGDSGTVEIPADGMDLERYLDDIEKQFLLKALEQSGGVRKKAADLLGMTFRSFRYKLAKHGMGQD